MGAGEGKKGEFLCGPAEGSCGGPEGWAPPADTTFGPDSFCPRQLFSCSDLCGPEGSGPEGWGHEGCVLKGGAPDYGAPNGGGSKGAGRNLEKVGPRKVGDPKFRAFFTFPATIFILPLLRVVSWNFGGGKKKERNFGRSGGGGSG